MLQYLLTLCELLDKDDPQPPVQIHIYFTGAAGGNLKQMTRNLLYQLYAAELDKKFNNILKIRTVRPDIANEIADFGPTAAFGCGPEGDSSSLALIIGSATWAQKTVARRADACRQGNVQKR